MHEKILPQYSLELLKKLENNSSPYLSGWTLAGGTGLAFILGHRISVDLDFFRNDDMNVKVLHDTLSQYGEYETLQESEHTLTVLIQDTKMSFFRVQNPMLFSPIPYRFFSIADIRDIALMKLAAIASRGSRKDFADLYFILQSKPTLKDYFDDAESEPMPQMLLPFSWDKCKSFFIQEAHTSILS